MNIKTFIKTFYSEDDLNDFVRTQEAELLDVKVTLDWAWKFAYTLIAKIKTYPRD